ncbi:hypothetical protein AcV7_010460 [Taiwanofungus camphoratus]|nr:hypothetical protein AcW2_010361 [Antrodia cinnamomea]KAI0947068.1 hypothetical protein AcV7_010460 [Antrodia cinnamomea]
MSDANVAPAVRIFLPTTPTKPNDYNSKITANQFENFKTQVAQVQRELRGELAYSVFSDTPEFLDTLFNISSRVIDNIYTRACSAKPPRYSRRGKYWTNIPITTEQEDLLYEPFVDIANFITDCCHGPKLPIRWISDPNRSPIPLDSKSANMRPDIVATVNFPDTTSSPSLRSRKRKQVDNPRPPWNRIHVPMEVKKSSADGPALLQLLQYQRQVFHESVDRRFVFGLALAQKNLYVYIADRSGVLGAEVFDIHQEPKKLIRVIAGICMLPPSSLGWDTSLLALERRDIFASPELLRSEAKLSYEFIYAESPSPRYWTIKMPKPQTDDPCKMHSNMSETFVLWKSISLVRGEIIRGRATRIWKAWHEKDMHLPEEDREVYIVKDTWRDDRRDLEGALYAQIGHCEGVAEMYSYCVVTVDEEQDTTETLIRRQLRTQGKPRVIDAKQAVAQKETEVPRSSPDEERYGVTQYTMFLDYLPEELPPGVTLEDVLPRGRTHSRLVMKTYGWPVKYAKSVLETVEVFRDAIIGHRNSVQKGVLHRDISLGNILITGKSERGHRGVLIDYDNAIPEEHVTLADDPATGTHPFMSPEILGGRRIIPRPGTRGHDSSQEPEVPKHSFIHDLESFFWCLVWLCMSRDGPERRRTELFRGDNQPKNKALRRFFANLFEGLDDLLVATKVNIFRCQPDFSEMVLNNVTDYYRPLVPLLSDFYQILLDAYTDERQKLDMDIYNKVIAAFESIEEQLNDQPIDVTEEYCRLREKEEERRRQDCYGHWDHYSPKVGESAQDPASSSPDVPSSPIPARKRARLEAPSEHSDRDDQPSNRGSSTSRGRRRARGRASTPGQGRASNRDQTSSTGNRRQSATGGRSSHSGQPSRGTQPSSRGGSRSGKRGRR